MEFIDFVGIAIAVALGVALAPCILELLAMEGAGPGLPTN